MKTTIVSITPAMAQKWLEMVVPEKQRSRKENLVGQYANAMKRGHWIVTHQGIAFDSSGSLCDGQHRLAAIVMSGVTVAMNVTTDMPEKQRDLFTFDAIDRGRLRGIGEQLQVRHGVTNANVMAAAARVIASLCKRGTVVMTVASAVEIIDRFGTSMRVMDSAFRISTLRASSFIGTMAFCHRAMPKQLDDFVARLADGEGLKRGSPALTLRNHMLIHKVKGGAYLCGHERATALSAMHYVLGNNLSLIKQTSAGIDFFSDKQPRIVDEIASMF